MFFSRSGSLCPKNRVIGNLPAQVPGLGENTEDPTSKALSETQ